ncbi:MAG: hypothetical protein M3012_04930 [Staphylococcus epidermidis]|nr:hypothetical protein [Staphylococcus epidermidis]
MDFYLNVVIPVISVFILISCTLIPFVLKTIPRHNLKIDVIFKSEINKDSVDVDEQISIKNTSNRAIYLEDMYINLEGRDFRIPKDMKKQLNVCLRPGDIQTIHSVTPTEWASKEEMFEVGKELGKGVFITIEDSEGRTYNSKNIIENVQEVHEYREGLKTYFYFENDDSQR